MNNKNFIKIRKEIININYLYRYIIIKSALFNYNRIYVLNNLSIKVFYEIYT